MGLRLWKLSSAYEPMRTRRAVLLTPPLQTPASPKIRLSPFVATDPKEQPVSRKCFRMRSYKKKGGGLVMSSRRLARG
jgi:hypothetical protein